MAEVSHQSDDSRDAALSADIVTHEIIHARTALNLGVSRSEITALMVTCASTPVTPTTLGEALSLTSGSITILIDRLEDRLLIRREPHPGDRRSLLLSATPAGCDLVARFLQAFQGNQRTGD